MLFAMRESTTPEFVDFAPNSPLLKTGGEFLLMLFLYNFLSLGGAAGVGGGDEVDAGG